MVKVPELRVAKLADVAAGCEDSPAWLIETLWGAGAVGVIGGAPKLGKSWLALEMAVAVGSGAACLGRWAVPTPGPVLVYAAEDAPEAVRQRAEHLARARGVDLTRLRVWLILESSLRLDRAHDRERLRATLARYRPKLLILDPYVRLVCGVDENHATQVSAILGALREMSRTFGVAIALVHHTRKGAGEELGEGLRGSSDFHAWGDSNLYLKRRREGLVLSIEHRAAAAPAPVMLGLVNREGPVRLEVCGEWAEPSLPERVLRCVQEGPLSLEEVRGRLRVRKQHLAEVLRELEDSGRVVRTRNGWRRNEEDAGGGPRFPP